MNKRMSMNGQQLTAQGAVETAELLPHIASIEDTGAQWICREEVFPQPRRTEFKIPHLARK